MGLNEEILLWLEKARPREGDLMPCPFSLTQTPTISFFFVNSSLAACVCVCLAVFNINVFFFFQLSPSNHAFSSRFVYRLPHAMEKEAIAPNGDGIIANYH